MGIVRVVGVAGGSDRNRETALGQAVFTVEAALSDPLHDAGGEFAGMFLARAGEYYGKLLTAVSRDNVGRAADGMESSTDRCQGIVPLLMAVMVVVDLEVVDIYHEEENRAIVNGSLLDLCFEGLVEMSPIVHARE